MASRALAVRLARPISRDLMVPAALSAVRASATVTAGAKSARVDGPASAVPEGWPSDRRTKYSASVSPVRRARPTAAAAPHPRVDARLT